MRIALVAQEYPPETAKGGIGTQTFLKAHGLASLGHEVHVISRSPNGHASESSAGGVQVTRIPGFDARMAVYTEVADWLTYSAQVAAQIAALNARTPIDVIDFPEWAAEGYVHLLNQTEWNRIPSVVHLHGPLIMFAHAMGWPDLDSEFYHVGTMMEGACIRRANAVFSSSACSADWCARHYGLERATVPVLHTGVDTALFRPLPVLKAERPTIVFAGKLVPNKGVTVLVEAACRLVRDFPGLRVHLLGRAQPNMIAQLQQRARDAGASDLLEFAGFVDRTEVPQHFSRAHVFAMPSQYEPGPGLVYLEAMACGLPVIACDGAGAAEVVREGENGMLVPPQDPARLAAALGELLADQARCEAMGAAARDYVLTAADSRECIRKLEAFYLGVARGTRDRAPRETDSTPVLLR